MQAERQCFVVWRRCDCVYLPQAHFKTSFSYRFQQKFHIRTFSRALMLWLMAQMRLRVFAVGALQNLFFVSLSAKIPPLYMQAERQCFGVWRRCDCVYLPQAHFKTSFSYRLRQKIHLCACKPSVNALAYGADAIACICRRRTSKSLFRIAFSKKSTSVHASRASMLWRMAQMRMRVFAEGALQNHVFWQI
jgi:hypothetical protein